MKKFKYEIILEENIGDLLLKANQLGENGWEIVGLDSFNQCSDKKEPLLFYAVIKRDVEIG